MNRGELIEAVAAELGQTRPAAEQAVDAVIHAISKGVKADDSVRIMGFGTFVKRRRNARPGHNPATGEAMWIEASQTVGFRPSPALKRELQREAMAGSH